MTNDVYEEIRREPIVPCISLVHCNFLEGTNLCVVCSSLTFDFGEVT